MNTNMILSTNINLLEKESNEEDKTILNTNEFNLDFKKNIFSENNINKNIDKKQFNINQETNNKNSVLDIVDEGSLDIIEEDHMTLDEEKKEIKF